MARGAGGPLHHCFIGDCQTWCTPTQVACTRHLDMLTDVTRHLLWKHYRPGAKPTKVFLRHLEQALREVVYFEEHQHKWPVEQLLSL